MSIAEASSKQLGDADVFLRLWEREQLTPTLARHLLKLKFSDTDQARIRDLAEKNRAGVIKPAELSELDEFVRASAVLSVLQSRARKILKRQRA